MKKSGGLEFQQIRLFFGIRELCKGLLYERFLLGKRDVEKSVQNRDIPEVARLLVVKRGKFHDKREAFGDKGGSVL